MRLEETEKRFLAPYLQERSFTRHPKRKEYAVEESPSAWPTPEDIREWEESHITKFCTQLAEIVPRGTAALAQAAGELGLRKVHTAVDLIATIRGFPGPSLEKRRQCLADIIAALPALVTVEDVAGFMSRVLKQSVVSPAG